MTPPRPPSLRLSGVAGVLEAARQRAADKMRSRLRERIASGYLDACDAEVDMLARIAGLIAREVCAEVAGEAFLLGRNHGTAPEAHTEDTRKIPPRE